MSVSDKHGDGAMPPGRAPRRFLLRQRTWGVLSAAAVLAIGITIPATSFADSRTPLTVAAGDPAVISDWNAIAVTTLLGDTSKQLPEDFLYVGFVQAAAVAAAHKILVTYVPSAQASLDADYATSLAQVPDGPAKTNGIAFGTRTAGNLIRQRADDGRNAPIFFTQPPAPGVWRPTPPANLPMYDPWLAFVTPMLVRSATQFGPPGPPPALTSARYTRDFAEVKAFGAVNSTVRTPAQTSTAMFFSGNALVQFNTALRDQVTVRHLDIVDAAHMFAAVDMATADADITVWHAKYIYGFWRPITAIQLADTDGNPATSPDPSWMPVIATPPYPEYPSGYNAVAATVSRSLADVFHTQNLNLTLTSTAVPDVRHYDSGAALRQDVVDARVWLGIHFRTADTVSRNLGIRLADWVLDHYFQPVHGRG